MHPERGRIRNIVFDVGNVLLPINYERFVAYLAESGVDLSDMPGWLARIGLEAHERGELGGEAFLERMARTSARSLDTSQLKLNWLDMFEQAPDMFALATGLMAEYRVYLLSNIGDLHWEYLDARFGLSDLVHGALPSFRVGASKPSSAIYREAERLFELDAARTVFIDDLRVNVSGAEACGWRAIHHRDPAATRAELRSLDVRLPAAFRGQ